MIRVDCLMPTLPERADMRARAIRSFTLQEVPENWDVALVIESATNPSLGHKLNQMIARSLADFFVLLDDDDWHHPLRVLKQIEPLITGKAEVSGTSKIYYFDERKNSAFLYSGNCDWLGGLAFSRTVWERCHFDDLSQGVDYRWQKKSKAKKLDLELPSLFVAGIHGANTCAKNPSGPRWRSVMLAELPAEFIQTKEEAA